MQSFLKHSGFLDEVTRKRSDRDKLREKKLVGEPIQPQAGITNTKGIGQNVVAENAGDYPVTYHHPKTGERRHFRVPIDKSRGEPSNTYITKMVHDSPQAKKLKAAGYEPHTYGSHALKEEETVYDRYAQYIANEAAQHSPAQPTKTKAGNAGNKPKDPEQAPKNPALPPWASPGKPTAKLKPSPGGFGWNMGVDKKGKAGVKESLGSAINDILSNAEEVQVIEDETEKETKEDLVVEKITTVDDTKSLRDKINARTAEMEKKNPGALSRRKAIETSPVKEDLVAERKVDPADVDEPEGKEDDGTPEHPIMQARKVISMRGKKPFHYANGDKRSMHPNVAHAVIARHDSFTKPHEKEAFAKRIIKSPEHLHRAMHGQEDPD